jgi:hypothetical protein
MTPKANIIEQVAKFQKKKSKEKSCCKEKINCQEVQW